MSSLLKSWIVVLSVFIAAVPMLWLLTRLKTETEVSRLWLPAKSWEKTQYDRFIDLFGVDDVLLVSWPGCTAEDPRLVSFRERLAARDDQSLFGRMVSGDEMISQLTGPPTRFSSEKSHRRLRGMVIGMDGSTTGAVLYLSDRGRNDHRAAVALVRQAAEECPGLGEQQICMGGNVYVSVLVDEETQHSMLLGVPACLLAVAIGWICFRNIRLTVISFLTSGLAAGFSMALVQLCGEEINGLLVLMPGLILVLTMSGAVHLLNYYRDALRSMANARAVRQALRDGWRPCVLASVTTCIGIGSLLISQILAVRLFGLFSGVSLLLATALLLIFLPCLLIVWPPSKNAVQQIQGGVPRRNRKPVAIGENAYVSCLLTFLQIRQAWCFLAVGILIAFAATGLPRIRAMLRLERFFPAGSRVASDLAWLQEHFISQDNVQVIVGIHDDSADTIADQALRLRQVQASLAKHDRVQATYSIHNVIGTIPTGHSMGEIFERVVVNEELAKNKASLIRDQFFAEQDGWRYWKIHVTVKAHEPFDYRLLIEQLRNLSADQMDETGKSAATREIFVTGICPIFAQAQRQLFNDLAGSFLLAFVLICPLMMLILRSVLAGLVAMIPNVLPVAMVFGALGWLNVPMDIGTILTASVGLGIAVDDTVHLLEWYMKAPREVRDRRQALQYALGHCSGAMIQTTMICGLGLLVFSASRFIPVRHFSLVIAALLAVALLADLLLLPLLILSPIGTVFSRSNTRSSAPERSSA